MKYRGNIQMYFYVYSVARIHCNIHIMRIAQYMYYMTLKSCSESGKNVCISIRDHLRFRKNMK